jgi:hypothetical protein
VSDTMSKQDYLDASRGLAVGFGPTQDFADPTVGKTAQSIDGIPPAHEGLPGQVFAVEQLPDPRIALASGFVPAQIPEYLIIEGDDVGTHTQGPTHDEIRGFEVQAKTGHPTLAFDGEVRTADEAMQSFNDQTGPNAKARENVGAATDNTPKDSGKVDKSTSNPAATPSAPASASSTPASAPVSTSSGQPA